MSDLEDKQLRANFSLLLKPRYFWLSRLQRTGGIGTWLSPKGPEPEAKKKKKTNTFLFTVLQILWQSLSF